MQKCLCPCPFTSVSVNISVSGILMRIKFFYVLLETIVCSVYHFKMVFNMAAKKKRML